MQVKACNIFLRGISPSKFLVSSNEKFLGTGLATRTAVRVDRESVRPQTKVLDGLSARAQKEKTRKGLFLFVRVPGVEPGTYRVSVDCSTS